MNKPLGMLIVGCNPKTIKTIAITCRCGNRWTEQIPQEVHDSTMTVILPCCKCDTTYTLRDKTLTRMEDSDRDRIEKQAFGVNTAIDTKQFDA